MTIDVVLPKYGMTMTGAQIVEWLVNVGDSVMKDADLVEVETDKVNTVVPAPESGVLVEVCAQVGEEVTVGDVLGRLDPA